jgi:uncharacterized protein YecT (DUF1311 family)
MFQARFFFALVCLASVGFTRASTDCGSATSHADQRDCLGRSASASRAELEKVRASLVKRIETWDEDPVYRQRSLTLLKQSFMHFERFRNSECEYEAAAAAGGNGAGDMRLKCQVDLNKQYAESLQKQLNWFTTAR